MNFILSIPFDARLAILAVCGACLGSLVNFLVVRLEYSPRSVCPWFVRSPDAAFLSFTTGSWIYRLPIVGWLLMRRKMPARQAPRQTGFWIRPLIIELACAVGLAALYAWEIGDPSSRLLPAILQNALLLPMNAGQRRQAMVALHCVFASHACLSVLMLVASLIDMDEGLIPDEITVPGTLLGLFLAALLPTVLLPVMVDVGIPAGALRIAHKLDFLTFSAPREWPWPSELLGTPDVHSLAAGLACVWAWCFALLPRLWRTRHGLRRAWTIFWRICCAIDSRIGFWRSARSPQSVSGSRGAWAARTGGHCSRR